MPDRDHYEALLAQHFLDIQKVIAAAGARLGLRGHVDDFRGDVFERLCEDDYAALRKWRGDSKLMTYLTVVIANYGREFRVKLWGRWRASAAALRLGPLAVQLETLVYRDRMTLAEACELLRTRGDTRKSDRELAELFARIPSRMPARGIDDREVKIDDVVDERGADDHVVGAEDDAVRRVIHHALSTALAALDPRTRVVVRMYYFEGRTIADIARVLGVDQRPLYRVKVDALATLQRHLLATGITPDQIRDVLGGTFDDGSDFGDDDHPGGGAVRPSGDNPNGPRPSNEVWDSNPRDEASGSSDSEQSERSES